MRLPDTASAHAKEAGAVALVLSIAVLVCLPVLESLLLQNRAALVSGPPGDNLYYLYYLRSGLEKLGASIGAASSNGSLFDAGYYYPSNERSLLYSEPMLGDALLVAPLHALTRDAISTLSIATGIAIVAGWLSAYALTRILGG